MNLDILGLAEVIWLKSGKLLSDEHMLIYSGDIKEHKHGVGMLQTNVQLIYGSLRTLK